MDDEYDVVGGTINRQHHLKFQCRSSIIVGQVGSRRNLSDMLVEGEKKTLAIFGVEKF